MTLVTYVLSGLVGVQLPCLTLCSEYDNDFNFNFVNSYYQINSQSIRAALRPLRVASTTNKVEHLEVSPGWVGLLTQG